MKDMLYAVLALVSVITAGFLFFEYTRSADNKLYLVFAIVFGVLFVALGALFMSGRVNKNEDIHITE